jgi:hypothetical protein
MRAKRFLPDVPEPVPVRVSHSNAAESEEAILVKPTTLVEKQEAHTPMVSRHHELVPKRVLDILSAPPPQVVQPSSIHGELTPRRSLTAIKNARGHA